MKTRKTRRRTYGGNSRSSPSSATRTPTTLQSPRWACPLSVPVQTIVTTASRRERHSLAVAPHRKSKKSVLGAYSVLCWSPRLQASDTRIALLLTMSEYLLLLRLTYSVV